MNKNYLNFIVVVMTVCVVTTRVYPQAGWTWQTSNTVRDLYSIRFVSSMVGVAVGDGGTIIRTQDAGLLWTPVNGGTGNRLYSIAFANE